MAISNSPRRTREGSTSIRRPRAGAGLIAGLAFTFSGVGSAAVAAEQVVIAGGALKTDEFASRGALNLNVLAPLPAVPASFHARNLPEAETFSSRDFRPRGASIRETEAAAEHAESAGGTTPFWQRFSDFRSRNRVRLLTLWETRGSSLTLQAGSRASPSLQWTSRFQNHASVSRGVFDPLFSMSRDTIGRTLNMPARPKIGELPGKPAKLSEAGGK